MGVFSRTARSRRGVLVGLAAGMVTALTALGLPIPPPEPGVAGGRRDVLDGPGGRRPAPEDLTTFLDSRRWGGESLQDVRRRTAAVDAATAERRVVDKVGLVGLTAVKNRRASLIQLPDGVIVRFVPGDILPDGRSVKAATDKSVTLEDDDNRQAELLNLFPPIPEELRFAGPDAEGQGVPVDRHPTPAS